MEREVITKLDAACRQLDVAIHMFFARGDKVAVHTLACAAREIFEKHCQFENRHRLFDVFRERHPNMSEKQLWEILNRARNFFKHADPTGDLTTTVELSDADNQLTLFIATNDCISLLDKQTPIIFSKFATWHVATQAGYRKFFPELDLLFPGLQQSGAEKQMAAGRYFVLNHTPKAWALPNLDGASL